MYIYGIGTDIINITRIEKMVNKIYYTRFYNRILSKNEVKEYILIKEREQRSIYLAKRFSAKEALLKALGTGYRLGIAFNEIEIVKDELGKPMVDFLGKTLEIAQGIIKNDFTNFISWSDEDSYIISFAIIQVI